MEMDYEEALIREGLPRRGAPPKPGLILLREEVKELKKRMSWPNVQKTMNRRHGANFTVGRYRQLLANRSTRVQ